MAKSNPALPVETKLDYTTIDGVPTISIAAALTTQAHVATMIKQLEKLAYCLPETKTRKTKAKSKNGPRVTRPIPTEEKVV